MQRADVQHELAALTKRGFTYRVLDSDRIELTDPVTGEKRLMSLRQPSEESIRSWASSRRIPILEINPALIDTAQFAGWYNHWRQVPISNDVIQPLVVADVDGNGIPEIYGLVAVEEQVTIIESRIFEVDPPSFRHTYQPYPGIPTAIVDIDNDRLHEILFSGQSGLILSDFRQQQEGALPTVFNFSHLTTNSGVVGGWIPPVVGFLDGDSLVDCLYKVVEIDSSDSTLPFVSKAVVAEYDTLHRSLRRVWATRIPPAGQPADAVGPFTVADFDQDGRQEFATTGGLQGHVFLCENTGDNAYALVYQDSTPFVNLYKSASGDVDGDGKPEFFVAATEGDGQWALMYEADSNDHYSAKLLFHFLSGGPIDFPTYLTADIDGDGKLELLTTSGPNIFIFKSNGDNSYRLWYYKREDRLNAVQVYDFNNDGRLDLVLSKDADDSLGRLYYYSDLYLATPLMSVGEHHSLPIKVPLLRNYPNPFNSSTRIHYSIPSTQRVNLRVFDILGSEADVLMNDVQTAGEHEATWDASRFASGIYFCRMETQSGVLTIKLLLLR